MTTQPQQNAHLTLKVLWAALAAAQIMFVFLAHTMAQAENPNPPQDTEVLKMVLTFAAVGAVVMSFVLAKFGAKQASNNLKKKGLNGDSADLATLAQGLVVPSILRWALLESATLNGFLLSLFTRDTRYVMAFAAVSLVGFALTFPSERFLRSQISA